VADTVEEVVAVLREVVVATEPNPSPLEKEDLSVNLPPEVKIYLVGNMYLYSMYNKTI